MPSIPNEMFRMESTFCTFSAVLRTRLGKKHSGSSLSTLIVGWMVESEKEGILPASSSAPAAPMVWPMKDLVLLM